MRNKLRRITEETYRQGYVLSQEDIAYKVLNCKPRTVQRDAAVFKKAGVHISRLQGGKVLSVEGYT